MDEAGVELIALLGTRIGMVMEDTAPVALTLGSLAKEERALAVQTIVAAAREIEALANAIGALCD